MRVCTRLDRHSKIAIDTAHGQAPFLQRVQVGAASHERDIRTALGQESTEIAPRPPLPITTIRIGYAPLWRRISLARRTGMSSDSTTGSRAIIPFWFGKSSVFWYIHTVT